MEREDFTKLLNHGETLWIEYKSDFPRDLNVKKNISNWNKAKAIFLKDLVSIANGNNVNEIGYLVYGVKDLGSRRIVVGISKSWDDAYFQSWSENIFYPPVLFNYIELLYQPGINVGIFEIKRSPKFPHVVKRSLGNVLFKGQLWFKRGTKNTVATYDDLLLFFDNEPFKINRLGDPMIDEIADFYRNYNRSIEMKLLSDKQRLLKMGYKIVNFPNTNKEIWVWEHIGQFKYILMSKE